MALSVAGRSARGMCDSSRRLVAAVRLGVQVVSGSFERPSTTTSANTFVLTDSALAFDVFQVPQVFEHG